MQLMILDDEVWQGPLDRTKLESLVSAGCNTHGWRIVVIDYLGLMAKRPEDKNDEFMADCENSTVLKRIARQNKIALVVVHACRKPTTQNPGPPQLKDVLGAGRIGYDATNVITVDREAGIDASTINLYVRKSRYSAADGNGVITLPWHADCGHVGGRTPIKAAESN